MTGRRENTKGFGEEMEIWDGKGVGEGRMVRLRRNADERRGRREGRGKTEWTDLDV